MATVFRATVELMKSSGRQYGRSHATSSGYCPHIVVEGKGALLGVKFLEAMKHGMNDVIFETLYKNIDYSAIQEGVNFEVREGEKVIGTGHIVERVD